MAKFIALIVATTVALVAAEEQPVTPIETHVLIVPDIAAYRAANPGIELIPLEVAKSARQQIVYSLGNRISGDRLVASDSNSQAWGSLQDVQLTQSYPRSGTGAIVTYVQVTVNQSSNLGRGYVTSGGIGQRYITVVIEANLTTYFNYQTFIYGY